MASKETSAKMETMEHGTDLSEGKGLLFKKILKEGTGEDTPACGCKVTVHYVGTLLDGTPFDSSRDRNEPFDFTLGKGHVIKAWDNGVATMKRGELCVLTCAPEYGYGVSGSPPKIPPNAWLKFEVEMIDWQGEDISPKKNNAIVRYSITSGTGYDRPNEGTLVDVDLVGKLHGVKDAEPFETRSVQFNLGEGSEFGVCYGVEKALEKFTLGETSRLVIQPKYAFKSAGDAALGVPADAVVEYTVTLKSFEKVDEDSESYEYVMQLSRTMKDKGTNYFKAGKFPLAVKMYKRALEYLSKSNLDGETNPEEKNSLLLSVNLNLSLCYLKLTPPQPLEARDSAVNALKLDPDNVKGLFRHGQALQTMGEHASAVAAFKRVIDRDPGNKAALNQIAICVAAVKTQKDKEKKLYANMFEKFAQIDTQTEKLSAMIKHDVMAETLEEWGSGSPTEWADTDRDRAPTDFEKENPNILMLNSDGHFADM